MSIKSLLQIILFLLILVIVGGIYYLYFYSGSLNDVSSIESLEKLEEEKSLTEENEILESMSEVNNNIKLDNSVKKEDNLNNAYSENDDKSVNNAQKKEIVQNNILEQNIDNEEIKNLTKEIEYITSNKNGDVFKIRAKYGKSNLKNANVLDLKYVNGEILSDKRSTIYVSSDLANYNYTNQNSKFYKDVVIKYDNKTITCDKLDLMISENIALAYSNVVVKDDKSIMKAQIITLDIITKDININSEDKINIVTNN